MTFSPVSRAVPTWVLKQGAEMLQIDRFLIFIDKISHELKKLQTFSIS